MRGPIFCESAPIRAESSEHHRGGGRQRGPDFEGRVAERVLQVHDDEEEHAPEAGVDRQRDEVRTGELARPEQLEREHGMGSASLDEHEREQQEDARDDCDDGRGRPVAAAPR